MERWRHIISITLFLSACLCASAQRPIGIAYYDVDRLYDTIPSPFYNDNDYTPAGRYGWDTQRYRRKITNTAAVIDSMALPIIALWGVENLSVVRDIAAQTKGDYSYLHRTLNSFNGMDFALLYYGDLFFPQYIDQGRNYLYVEGTLRGITTGFILCSEARMIEWVVRDLRDERRGVRLIVMGRSASWRPHKYGLRDSHTHAARQGRGNIHRQNRWEMRDRIVVDTTWKFNAGEVYMRRFLIDEKSGSPLKTFETKRYNAGYGYALPIYLYIE